MSRGKYAKRKNTGKVLYFAAIAVLLAIFIGSGCYVASYYLDSRQQESRYDELAAIVEAAKSQSPTTAVPSVSGTSEDTDPTEGSDDPDNPTSETQAEGGILLEYQPLYDMNPDIVGWIQIEDTQINYPVMQTPDMPDYYLKRNFDRQSNSRGCIYAKEECDVSAPSDNITIYGHHMNDGSMFAALSNYTSKSFWEEHRYIRFDTLTEHHTYEIFAVFKTTASVGKGFAYHNFIDAGDEAEFDEFIANCLSLAFYDTGITPEYGDKIICLSTCEYTQTNGRLVVAAMRIS